MNRSRNSIRNIVFGIGGQLLNILMSFAMRTVFIRALDKVYLGVNGLFTNILMVFSLADLGVGTAIIYALYKPIAENDTKKIQALMKLYQKAYTIIGFVIVALGLILMPFTETFAKTDQNIPQLKLIFMIFVINTASTYFFSYKGTLITANQKHYIVSAVVYATSILCYAIQIVIMQLTRNYILTLSIQVGTNMLQSIITMVIANRMYPFIRGKNNSALTRHEKRRIFQSMRSLMFYRTGQVIINGTDSIIISSFVGIVEAGVFSNYALLTTTVKNLLQQVFTAISASIGNLAVMESDSRKYQIYNVVYFGNFWMFGFAACCFFSLFQPFVRIWAGKDNLLTMAQMFFIVLNFYLIGMRNVNLVFRDAMGVFREGRYIPVASAIVNVGVSIFTALKLGLVGAFVGTTISMLTTLVWMEPVVLFKYGFKRSPLPYFLKYAMYFASAAAACALTYFATSYLPVRGLIGFILKALITFTVPNLVFFILYGRTYEFKFIYSKVKGMLFKKFKRKREAHA